MAEDTHKRSLDTLPYAEDQAEISFPSLFRFHATHRLFESPIRNLKYGFTAVHIPHEANQHPLPQLAPHDAEFLTELDASISPLDGNSQPKPQARIQAQNTRRKGSGSGVGILGTSLTSAALFDTVSGWYWPAIGNGHSSRELSENEVSLSFRSLVQ